MIRALRLLTIAGVLCSCWTGEANAQLPQTRLYSVYPPGAQAGATAVNFLTFPGDDRDDGGSGGRRDARATI